MFFHSAIILHNISNFPFHMSLVGVIYINIFCVLCPYPSYLVCVCHPGLTCQSHVSAVLDFKDPIFT